MNLIDKILLEGSGEKVLYHCTNIKHLESIKSSGLLPQWGEAVKIMYGNDYNLDGNKEDRREQIKPLLFFSNKPQLHFSNFMSKFKLEDALVCVIKNNSTIFRRTFDESFIDYQNREVEEINEISVYDLPIIIEDGDYFSFDVQRPIQLLYGEALKNLIMAKFPNEFKRVSR